MLLFIKLIIVFTHKYNASPCIRVGSCDDEKVIIIIRIIVSDAIQYFPIIMP